VLHLTSVHGSNDTRIYHRECRALTEAGYRTLLLTADPGPGPEPPGYATVRSIELPGVRLGRAVLGAWRLRGQAIASRARLIHLHDPELLALTPGLRRRGIRVVYDAHEDLVEQIQEKPWIPGWLRGAVAAVTAWLLPRLTRRLDGVVAATPDIAERHAGSRVVVVRNFPVLSELAPPEGASGLADRPPRAIYMGAVLTVTRGALEMADAAALVASEMPFELALAGRFLPSELEDEVRSRAGDATLTMLPELGREGVRAALASSRVGLVIEHPTTAYLRSLPVKMFEYMAAGLPIVASDFPLWRGIVEGAGCGILVDPRDPSAVAEAIRGLLRDPADAEAMGARGRTAAVERYDWAHEARTLTGLYEELLR
jgi:glycosyltransferase involved in cell wall biosynthesis